ncbi:MAG TPA: DMT family transporter [Armatimonadota bacterium]
MRSHVTGVLCVLAAVLLWSTVPVGTRLLVRDGMVFSPAFLSAARLWLAVLVFLILRAVHCHRAGIAFRVSIRHRGWLWIAAAAISANYLFYAIGLRYTTAGATSIISQVHSVATVLLAASLLGERLTKQKVLGTVVAMIGVLLVVFQGNSLHDIFSSAHVVGNLIEVLAALAWPFYAIGQTKLVGEDGNRDVLMPIFVLSALLSTLLLPVTGPFILHPPSNMDWAVLLFLGAGSTAAAYWLFAAGLQRMQTSEGAMFNVLMPPLALLMAHWLLGESLRPSVLAGLALVVAGLVLIVWRRGHSPLRKRSTPLTDALRQQKNP